MCHAIDPRSAFRHDGRRDAPRCGDATTRRTYCQGIGYCELGAHRDAPRQATRGARCRGARVRPRPCRACPEFAVTSAAIGLRGCARSANLEGATRVRCKRPRADQATRARLRPGRVASCSRARRTRDACRPSLCRSARLPHTRTVPLALGPGAQGSPVSSNPTPADGDQASMFTGPQLFGGVLRCRPEERRHRCRFSGSS